MILKYKILSSIIFEESFGGTEIKIPEINHIFKDYFSVIYFSCIQIKYLRKNEIILAFLIIFNISRLVIEKISDLDLIQIELEKEILFFLFLKY